jgi:hypothetical protein
MGAGRLAGAVPGADLPKDPTTVVWAAHPAMRWEDAHPVGNGRLGAMVFGLLVNELAAANRQFAMMAYPNRSHGISEGRGTALHLYTMFTDFFEENLPSGGRPR